jgi:hypothetical protein
VSLRNIDTDLDTAGVTRLVKTTEVVVEESVSVHLKRMESRAFVGKEVWAWDDLRDYVVSGIEDRFGAFPRDTRKESGIFKSFLARWGEQAQAIARYAFEVADGRWAGAPISVNRFCKGSDPYFAEVIVARLVDSPVKDW